MITWVAATATSLTATSRYVARRNSGTWPRRSPPQDAWATSSSYQGGQIGGAATAPSAKVQAEIEFLGALDLGGGFDAAETESEDGASDTSVEGSKQEEHAVDADGIEGVGAEAPEVALQLVYLL